MQAVYEFERQARTDRHIRPMIPTATARRIPKRTARAKRAAWVMKSYSAATRWRSAGAGSFQKGMEKGGRATGGVDARFFRRDCYDPEIERPFGHIFLVARHRDYDPLTG